MDSELSSAGNREADLGKRKGPWWSGDPSKSPRCGAKTRTGTPCRAPAMWSRKSSRYTRCRLHGGASTGPKTKEGQARCRRANWRHGMRSAEQIARRRALWAEWRLLRAELTAFIKKARKDIEAWEREVYGRSIRQRWIT